LRDISETDCEAVVHFHHAWSRPRCILCISSLSPRANDALEDNCAVDRLDVHFARVEISAALEGVLDLRADVVSRDFLRLHGDQVDHAFHAGEISHCALGGRALVLPLDLTLEGDSSIFDAKLDLLIGNFDVPLECAECRVLRPVSS